MAPLKERSTDAVTVLVYDSSVNNFGAFAAPQRCAVITSAVSCSAHAPKAYPCIVFPRASRTGSPSMGGVTQHFAFPLCSITVIVNMLCQQAVMSLRVPGSGTGGVLVEIPTLR